MNNCAKYEDLCSLCVDGLLTDAEETELMNHLQECSACAEYFEELKIIKDGFTQFDTAVPEELHETVMSAICKEAASRTVQYRQPKHRAPMFTMIAAAAAAVVMVMSGALGDIVNQNHGVVESKEEAILSKDEPVASDKSVVVADASIAESSLQPADSSNNGTESALPPKASEGKSEALPKAAPRALMMAPEPQKAKSAPPEMTVYSAAPADNSLSDDATGDSVQESIVIPESVSAESYAFCVVATGTENMPEVEGTLISGDIGGSQAFFTVSNSMTFLEKLMESLSKAGYEPTIDKSALVAQDKNADTGLVILIKK